MCFLAGKWVPTIARKIDMENPTASVFINLKGIGIGDGFMSPPDSAIYGDELYQVRWVQHFWAPTALFFTFRWASLTVTLETSARPRKPS